MAPYYRVRKTPLSTVAAAPLRGEAASSNASRHSFRRAVPFRRVGRRALPVLAWLSAGVAGSSPKAGRDRELIIRMAEGTGWGYRRILGELRKLRIRSISRATVARILIENGSTPARSVGTGPGTTSSSGTSRRCGRPIFSRPRCGRFGGRLPTTSCSSCMFTLAACTSPA